MADELLPATLTESSPNWTDEVLDLIAVGSTDGVVEAARSYQLESMVDAEYAMRRLRAIATRRREAREQAQLWHREIDDWFARVDQPLASRVAFIQERLEHYGVAMRALDPDGSATFRLPSGDVATTRHKATLTVRVDDDEALCKWAAEAMPGPVYDKVVKVTEHALVSELRKVVKITKVEGGHAAFYEDERVPGVTVEEEPESTTAKVQLS